MENLSIKTDSECCFFFAIPKPVQQKIIIWGYM